MARSRLTYAEAVRLLTGGADTVTVLSRLAGGALLLASPLVSTALSLFDAKGEANALLRDLVGAAPDRIRSARGKSHYELLEAAHTVLVLSAFFDALAELGGEQLGALELTDVEKRRLGVLRDQFGQPAVAMPGPLRGFTENAAGIESAFTRMHGALVAFASGLGAASRVQLPSEKPVVERALALYRDRYVRLAADVPEFAFWSQLDEHAATRTEVRRQTETLDRLAEMLSRTVRGGGAPAVETEQRLARHAALVLGRPLWRSDVPAPEGLSFPTVEQGFVSPRFRIAVADKEARFGDESWWDDQPERDDLSAFLAGYLTDPSCTQRPLVVLGHPGAGKSLLTEVLAARLPADAYTTVRVPLRRVDPDADIHRQVEATVERLVKEQVSWGELCRASSTTKVVLLDGFDELVQATGVAQSHYIDRAARFQQDEWVNGRPVVVVITSRTLVMDRTAVPDGTVVVKLEPFDEAQLERWASAWNAVNARHPGFRPLTAEELRHHEDLAGQPLLLLMLAVYAAEHGDRRLDAEDLSTDDLYRRLLDSFIRRQIREKAAADLGEGAFRELEAAGRRDLAVAAFAMFNRGRQYVSEEDLERDLDALQPGAERPEPRLGEPLTRAKRTVAAFFFVHVAQADDDTRAPGRRTYEFLHATFAEYLVAEHTVELLEELAEDWRRSLRRAYSAGLDNGVLRALLSHQPLTNGDEVTPFLIRLIDRLPADTRADLRQALLELFRGARKRIEDIPYRPTPFDVVHRLAAYTANLVVLTALCEPDGVAVDALCGHPDAPDLNSTVRLWRSGLDTEAQNSLFSRLLRADDRLTARYVEARSLPVCEAQLIGDTFTEAVLHTGRSGWYLPPDGAETLPVSPFQRDMHTEVIRLVTSRWPAPEGDRLMPFDETSYLELAARAEASGEPLAFATASLLASCLLSDEPHLPPELVDRLVKFLRARSPANAVQPMLFTLAVRRPEFALRNPALTDELQSMELGPFEFQVALAAVRDNPAHVEPMLEQLREALTTGPQSVVGMGNVTTSMVTGLAFAPHLLPGVLEALASYGEVAWSQVAPRDFRTAVEALGSVRGPAADALREYVACREAEVFEGDDAVAFEHLRAHLSGAGNGVELPDEPT
ncbi:hypothetical protein GCM10010399_36820 [Dactylosporangium fulvum]|uniref:NACHT N-terminal Helical domain-containing protein n=1 Tax=Dactylosporangium fulvum TaxID=53359 RepID=A0ABY5WB44_9ACTN|nr:hypothetical protein [Dactylosporangium fulvum]UWP86449.1 hypothetical protein Dfulv_20270 [Dactylosporangium fulvum]